MTGKTHSTGSPGIPEARSGNASPATVPWPSREPIDEMDDALARLRTLHLALMATNQMVADYSTGDAQQMVGEVLDQLNPIRTFLAENMPKGDEMSFVECRRARFALEGGVR